MNDQERRLIEDLFARLDKAGSTPRDGEAEQLIGEQMRRTPGAAYALAQTVIVQDHALREARGQIEQLQQATQNRPSGGGSFLGNLFGGGDPAPARTSVPPSGQRGGYAPPDEGRGDPRGAWQQAAPAAAAGGGGGFLRGAAQTAAGVAGGALLFEGVRSMFGGGGGFGGLGGGSPWGGQPVVNETVINEYNEPAQPFDTGNDAGWDNGSSGSDASDDGSFDPGGDFGGGDDSSWV